MDIDVKPFEVLVRKIQITCCENAHKCTKEQVCLGESGFRSAMHSSNVGSDTHID